MKLKLKKLTLIFITVLTLLLSSCVILTPDNDDEFVDISNGVITQKIIDANFTIFLSSYNKTILGAKTQEVNTQGSGVVFQKTTGTNNLKEYYLLTNNHVVYKMPNRNHHDYTVRDCYGQLYEARLICYNANYDLAVVSFTAQQDYKALSFASKNSKEGDIVVAMGQPLGIINSVTVGKVDKYIEVLLENDEKYSNEEISNVKFKVIKHTAPINSGSSGGVLLDKDYNICGINYAAAVVDGEGEFVSGYAIPLDKVLEFLTNNFNNLF